MANTNNISMETLKKEGSVRIQPGMVAVFPQFRQEEPLNLTELAPKFNGCYATNNSTVCFVSDNEIFVTPCTHSVLLSLLSAGFREESFYVPFSNGDYPKSEKFKWLYLREKAADQSYADDFIEDCIAYCDTHHIGTICDETLKNCFQMPTEGVKVKRFNFQNCYYPIINSTCLDSVALNQIGKYCTNNGRVVFVYRDGKTYVTKGYKILSELRAAGYTEFDLFVPFSNGEEILDPILKTRWESITK